MGNFAIGDYEAGLGNAIEMFVVLDPGLWDDFIQSLRNLGEQSGNAAVEALLNHFADYLSAKANGDQTTLRCG